MTNQIGKPSSKEAKLKDNHNKLNNELKNMSSGDFIRWAAKKYETGLYALSSFGTDSSVMFELLKQAGVKVPIITIDTGFLFEETNQYKQAMIAKYDLEVITFGPTNEVIDYVKKEKLWESHPELYNYFVKVEPLQRELKNKKIKALMSGIRHDQTETRKHKQRVSIGSEGEVRLHPILDWSKKDVEKYIKDNNLVRHPLFHKGYASVGDWTTTQKGSTRKQSRSMLGAKMECGIHVDTKHPE